EFCGLLALLLEPVELELAAEPLGHLTGGVRVLRELRLLLARVPHLVELELVTESLGHIARARRVLAAPRFSLVVDHDHSSPVTPDGRLLLSACAHADAPSMDRRELTGVRGCAASGCCRGCSA